jgi:hypothetical protein
MSSDELRQLLDRMADDIEVAIRDDGGWIEPVLDALEQLEIEIVKARNAIRRARK